MYIDERNCMFAVDDEDDEVKLIASESLSYWCLPSFCKALERRNSRNSVLSNTEWAIVKF